MSIDPVCGMEVNEEGAPSAEHQGKTYYFCCEGCKTAFSSDPEKYLNKSNDVSHGHHAGHHH